MGSLVNERCSNTYGRATYYLLDHIPDESVDSARSYHWRGAADEPKKLTINSIEVNAYIQKAGIDQHGKVAVPNNTHLAGWFADSVRPGNSGLSVIAGHVSGRTGGGIFKNLHGVKVGDVIGVELGNGKTVMYKTFQTQSVKEADAASALFSQDPRVTEQLQLITCIGTYDNKADTYDSRLIVSAERVADDNL